MAHCSLHEIRIWKNGLTPRRESVFGIRPVASFRFSVRSVVLRRSTSYQLCSKYSAADNMDSWSVRQSNCSETTLRDPWRQPTMSTLGDFICHADDPSFLGRTRRKTLARWWWRQGDANSNSRYYTVPVQGGLLGNACFELCGVDTDIPEDVPGCNSTATSTWAGSAAIPTGSFKDPIVLKDVSSPQLPTEQLL